MVEKTKEIDGLSQPELKVMKHLAEYDTTGREKLYEVSGSEEKPEDFLNRLLDIGCIKKCLVGSDLKITRLGKEVLNSGIFDVEGRVTGFRKFSNGKLVYCYIPENVNYHNIDSGSLDRDDRDLS